MLCALGLAAAAPRHDVSRTVLLRGAQLSAERLRELRGALLDQAAAALAGDVVRLRVLYELRYVGQSFELPSSSRSRSSRAELREAFAPAHLQRYGYRDDAREIELVNVRVSVWGAAPELRPRGAGIDERGRACSTSTARSYSAACAGRARAARRARTRQRA